MATAVAIDANLLLVFVVGSVRPDLLGQRRRLKDYMPSDFNTLCQIIDGFEKILLTPNVVTECSGLLGDSPEFDGPKQVLKGLLNTPEAVEERYVPSAGASNMPQFKFMGVADCAMLSLVDENTVLLTTDHKLAIQAQTVNPNCINFNHCRNFLA